MNGVTERLSIPKLAPYHYFRNNEEILLGRPSSPGH
jgi:hypothetical protein